MFIEPESHQFDEPNGAECSSSIALLRSFGIFLSVFSINIASLRE